MQTETLDAIGNYGMMLVICGLFVWQYMKSQKYNEEREEKLYSVIQTMSQILPEIKDKIDEILDELKGVEKHD